MEATTTDKTELEKYFRTVVERIFNNWQALRLAVEHGMGGPDSHHVAIQIMNYTYEYCVGNEDITQNDVNTLLEDLMDEEFNTICEDETIPQIARSLIRYKALALQKNYAPIEAELSKLPQGKEWLRKDVKITYTPVDVDSSDDDMLQKDDDDDVSMNIEDSDEETGATYSGQMSRSQARKREAEKFVEPEEGWTTVRRK